MTIIAILLLWLGWLKELAADPLTLTILQVVSTIVLLMHTDDEWQGKIWEYLAKVANYDNEKPRISERMTFVAYVLFQLTFLIVRWICPQLVLWHLLADVLLTHTLFPILTPTLPNPGIETRGLLLAEAAVWAVYLAVLAV